MLSRLEFIVQVAIFNNLRGMRYGSNKCGANRFRVVFLVIDVRSWVPRIILVTINVHK